MNLNNAAGLGDVASLRAFTSGSGLSYARASYQAPVGMGTLGVAYSSLGYKLGKEFAALQASGSARTTSLYGSYPLIRSRSRNLNLQLGLDTKTFQDKQDATASLIDKKSRVWTLSVSGDQRNSAGAGGITSYSLGAVAGLLDIQSAAALALDATSAKANGSYSKLLYSLTQQQNISEQTQLYASVFGQTASKNLDSSEKLGLGGANSVRAYPSGEAYGDQGYVLTLEARQTLPQASGPNGQLQAIGFIDTGSITVSKTPFVLTTPNSKRLSGWGLGVQWTGTNALIIKAYYARKLGSELATSAPDRSGRFWIQAVKYF